MHCPIDNSHWCALVDASSSELYAYKSGERGNTVIIHTGIRSELRSFEFFKQPFSFRKHIIPSINFQHDIYGLDIGETMILPFTWFYKYLNTLNITMRFPGARLTDKTMLIFNFWPDGSANSLDISIFFIASISFRPWDAICVPLVPHLHP